MENYVLEINPDDSSGSEKAYSQIIVEEDDEIIVEENDEDKPSRCRSTKDQIDFIDTQMDENNVFDEDYWMKLKTKLNELGPPERSLENWKRIWTVRKSRKKLHDQQTGSEPSVVAPTCDDSVPATQNEFNSEATQNEFNSEMLQKQDRIIYGLGQIQSELQKTNEMLVSTSSTLNKTNSLLEIIAKKYM